MIVANALAVDHDTGSDAHALFERAAEVSCRPTSRISDWTPFVWRPITDLAFTAAVGRVHFMSIQIAACGCWATGLHRWKHQFHLLVEDWPAKDGHALI
jgi:hypothetical protein